MTRYHHQAVAEKYLTSYLGICWIKWGRPTQEKLMTTWGLQTSWDSFRPSIYPRKREIQMGFLEPRSPFPVFWNLSDLFCHVGARGSWTNSSVVGTIGTVDQLSAVMSEVIRIKNEHCLSKYFPIYPWKIHSTPSGPQPPTNPHVKDSSNVGLPSKVIFFPWSRLISRKGRAIKEGNDQLIRKLQ